MSEKTRQIQELARLIASSKADQIDDIDWMEAARQTLLDHQIELFEIPSAKPGVTGHIGAAPNQIALQRAFFEMYPRDEKRIFVAAGANQSGKTQAIGGLCFCKWIRDKANDGDVFWVIAQNHDAMRDIPQKTMWEFLPHSMFPTGFEYNPRMGFGQIPTLKLELPNGRGNAEIWFKTEEMDLKSFESSRVNGIWWTECRREVLFDTIQPRLAARRGFLLMDYVPVAGWLKFRIRLPAETGENRYIYFTRFCMKDNAHNLPEGTIEYQRAQMTSEEAAVRIDGEDAAAFGVVYRHFDMNRHVLKAFEIPQEYPRWRTMDYGYRNPTAVLWATAVPAGFDLRNGTKTPLPSLIVYRELYETERTVEENAAAIKAKSGTENYRGPIIVDPTACNITQANGKSIAFAFAECGLPIRPGIRVNQYGNMAMVENVRRLFESDALYFMDNCPNAIREHASWRYKENREGSPYPGDLFEKKDDHTCDALKLLVSENPSYSSQAQGIVLDFPEDF